MNERPMSRRRRPVTRGRALLWALLAVILAGGIAAIGYFTPLMSVRSVEIVGNGSVAAQEIRTVAGVADGTPLLQVDTGEVARRVAAIGSVETARVQRSYPSTIAITVTERRPVAIRLEGEGESAEVHILDKKGVEYLHFDRRADLPVELRALPTFTTPNPGPTDPTTLAAMSAAAGLPPKLSAELLGIEASSPVDIEFHLKGNRTVIWGDSERGAEKARTLEYLLTRKATTYNVSSPDFPAYS